MVSKDSGRLVQIDQIVEKTIDTIEDGKKQIFEIAEESRQECKELESRLAELGEEIVKIIEQVDHLEKMEKSKRYRLMMISKNFNDFGEEDIRKAYEETKDIQVQLLLQRKQEEQLIALRSDLEHQLKRARSILERAEYITSHVASAMNYLKIALTNIDDTILEVKKKEELGIRIIMAQEEERQRVARDIHDGPAQSLSNLALKTELCEKLVNMDPDRARSELRDLKKLVRGSLQDIRKIIFDLRPMSLDDLGLVATLKQYINRFMDETGIDVILETYPEYVQIDPLVEVAVFRITQEALSNVAKHADASQVFINLRIIQDTLVGSFIDNGVGFNDKAQRYNRNKEIRLGGFGIYSMKQRAELLKGNLSIKSSIGKGTTLRLEIPLIQHESEREGTDDKGYDSR